MAELALSTNFGAELKDGFKPVNAWVTGGIQWLDDIQAFYRERSAIEKEYAAKLSALAKKYYEKKAKRSSSLSVGDNPTVTPGSLESASMTTWGVQLSTLEGRAGEHEQLGNLMVSGLADPLRNLGNKYEELRKQHSDYAAKLEKERDGSYGDLRKMKGKYDSACQEVENRRKKTESSFDYGKTKAQNAYNSQMVEMRNIKNSYLIAINVTNKQKERYYHEYIPELLESLQGLAEVRVATLNAVWSKAADLETQTMTRSTQLLQHLSGEIPRNNPILDSMMFARHNAYDWRDPADFGFEPSPVWLDDDVMASDPQSKTFLMNMLSKSKDSLTGLQRESDGRRKEVEGAKRVRKAIREGKDKRDEAEVVRAQFYNQELLHETEKRRTTAEVEVSTILANVGDVSASAKTHPFKNQTFKIPTNCDLCGDRIWGLSAKGLSCEECGFTCHTKCELKVPADCPGELTKEQKKAVKVTRQHAAAQQVPAQAPPPSDGTNGANGRSALQRSDTMGSMNTLSSGYAASAHRSVSNTARSSMVDDASPAPPASRPRAVTATADPQGKMLYAYTANDAGEISISENAAFTLLEPDDGSGWIRIRPEGAGAAPGLVPASYAQLSPTPQPPSPSSPFASDADPPAQQRKQGPAVQPRKTTGPAVAPRRGGAAAAKPKVKEREEKMVEALYTYAASGPGEVGMREGERLVLVRGDEGDGWVEVEGVGGRGVVPGGWVREV